MEVVPYQAPEGSWPVTSAFSLEVALGPVFLQKRIRAAPVIIPAHLFPPFRWKPGSAMEPVLFQASSALWPGLVPFPQASTLGVGIRLGRLPAGPWFPPALAVPPRLWESEEGRAIVPSDAVDTLHALNWARVAKTFAVMDMDESDSMARPKRGWGYVIKADVDRFSVEACPLERAALRWKLTEAVELYPCTGYAQVRPFHIYAMCCMQIGGLTFSLR